MNKFQLSMANTKKYLKVFVHKAHHIGTLVKTTVINFHFWSVDTNLYRNIGYEVGTIVLNGFFIWLMLFPFIETNPVWYIPSYGIIPWLLISVKQEMFK